MSTDSAEAPGSKLALRAQAPKHITLPPASPSSEVPYTRTYPATPLSPRGQREPNTNPFFILDEETPPIPTQRLPRFLPTPPTLVRRPTLPAQISLEHAFGNTRRDAIQPQEHRPKREVSIPSTVASCSCGSTRSQPEMSKLRKKTRTRPRAKTDLPALDTAGWSLDTPSFRSTAASTPSTGSSTPRNISLSEIPIMNGPIGCAVDIFGLAALQPPRMAGRPRPRIRQRVTTPDEDRFSPELPSVAIPNGLVFAARTAGPAKG
ncbi:hypothetical protein FRC11_008686 [Ceratobasidium sp. 423]|nr:hypothetical protein FRC11_008686 [Ceratobasidium sp. 423]